MFAGQVGQVVQRPAGQKGRSTKYHAPARVPAPRTRLQAQVALGVNLRTHGSSRITCFNEVHGFIKLAGLRFRIRINLSCWIRIGILIQIPDPDPDPGGQK
jgi:hypothetical protein